MPRFIRVRTFLVVLAVAILTPLIPPATASAQMDVAQASGPAVMDVAQASGPAIQVKSRLYTYNNGATAYMDIWDIWSPDYRVWASIRWWPNGVWYMWWWDQSIRQYRYWTWGRFVPQTSAPASGDYIIIGGGSNATIRSTGNPALDNLQNQIALQQIEAARIWTRPDCHLYGCQR